MQDIDIKKVKAFLAGHDYIVKVVKSDNGCKVIFPHPKITRPNSERETIEYKISREKEVGVYVNDEFWSAPEYALRLMITCDILNRMKKIPIHESLINYYDQDKEVESLHDVLSGPNNIEDNRREGFLAGLISKAIEDKFPAIYEDVANSPAHNVGTGYRLLKSFF
jgi:hypothetical protein